MVGKKRTRYISRVLATHDGSNIADLGMLSMTELICFHNESIPLEVEKRLEKQVGVHQERNIFFPPPHREIDFGFLDWICSLRDRATTLVFAILNRILRFL